MKGRELRVALIGPDSVTRALDLARRGDISEAMVIVEDAARELVEEREARVLREMIEPMPVLPPEALMGLKPNNRHERRAAASRKRRK